MGRASESGRLPDSFFSLCSATESGRLHGQRSGCRHHVAGFHQSYIGTDTQRRYCSFCPSGPCRRCRRHFWAISCGALYPFYRRRYTWWHFGRNILPRSSGRMPAHSSQKKRQVITPAHEDTTRQRNSFYDISRQYTEKKRPKHLGISDKVPKFVI